MTHPIYTMRYRPIPHHLKSITSIRHSWQIPTVRYSSVAPEHNGALLRRFVPDPIKDGEVDGEGDGSDVYQSAKETTERWDVPAGTPLMGVRLGGVWILLVFCGLLDDRSSFGLILFACSMLECLQCGGVTLSCVSHVSPHLLCPIVPFF